MARPSLPDDALVGDAGHATDHNILRNGIAELYLERQTGVVDPEGQVTGPVGMFYVNSTNGKLWVKITGTGNTGWGNASAGATDHQQLAGLTTGDPHTQYQQESERNVANGYAGLDANVQVPVANQALQVPIGAIIAYGGASAPTGWLLCDGTAIAAQYTVLKALVGNNTPNLRDRFIVGAGTSYAANATGGLATVTLTALESGLRDHAHSAGSGTVSADHTHSGTTSGFNTNHQHYVSVGGGGHGHNASYGNNWQGSGQDQNPAGNDYAPIGNATDRLASAFTDGAHGHANWSDPANTDHSHTFSTGGISANHTHSVTVNASGAYVATNAHENRPPYYALTYIIRAA